MSLQDAYAAILADPNYVLGAASSNGLERPIAKAVGLAELLAREAAPYDWLVPGLIERGDRTILTGVEGQGKSTLLRQMGVQIASGIHPFTLEAIEARHVLDIDCENSENQIRRKVGGLRDAAGSAYDDDIDLLRFEFHPEGIDLLRQSDQDWLRAVIEINQPEILIIGPTYKLAGGDPTEEQTAKAVATVLDRLRVEYGLALLIEAHSPYTENTKAKRVERPFGASLWSRWPEFGIYLSPEGHLRHWRGQRDEREWPLKLERGEPWPWMVAEAALERNSDDPWRPTHCIDAILALLNEQPERQFSTKQLRDTLRLQGEGYRDQTVSFSAELAAKEGLLEVRTGARNARLFQAKPVDKSDLFPPVPTCSDMFPAQVGEGLDDLFPPVPDDRYVVPVGDWEQVDAAPRTTSEYDAPY